MHIMISTINNKAKATLTISDDVLTQAKILAVRKKVSLSAVTEMALKKFICEGSDE